MGPTSGPGEEGIMSIIKFDPKQSQRIADFLDSLPDIGQMDADTLKAYRLQTQQAIQYPDELEPRRQASEAYALWADLHEELEDVLDEILDCLEDLGD